mmetsp:Transcript_46125/g.142098  ORF Transcript_46125/g.142098 Transcript_46125/m.142098 type:complete len:205 (+) Transcript_46125:3749-4363(+)
MDREESTAHTSLRVTRSMPRPPKSSSDVPESAHIRPPSRGSGAAEAFASRPVSWASHEPSAKPTVYDSFVGTFVSIVDEKPAKTYRARRGVVMAAHMARRRADGAGPEDAIMRHVLLDRKNSQSSLTSSAAVVPPKHSTEFLVATKSQQGSNRGDGYGVVAPGSPLCSRCQRSVTTSKSQTSLKCRSAEVPKSDTKAVRFTATT